MDAKDLANASRLELWTAPTGDEDAGAESARVMWAVAAGEIEEEELAIWIAERIGA